MQKRDIYEKYTSGRGKCKLVHCPPAELHGPPVCRYDRKTKEKACKKAGLKG
jgi:hypothetical protein